MISLSCNDVGTHSMQRLFEIVTLKEEKEVIFEHIKDHIVDMAFHPKGNYVLILAFQILEEPSVEYIVDKLLPNFLDMTFDQLGICIANRMIQHSKNQDHIAKMAKVLADNIVQII